MEVSIIIPVYNEAGTLPLILEKVQKTKPAEIIIVDDCSTDGTSDFLAAYKSKNAMVIRHPLNSGKGAAIQTALQAVTGDIVIIQDADLEYDPSDYPKLIKPIEDGHADVVYGSRFVGSSPHRVLFFWHYFGNKVITLLTNLFANLNLSDVETCYKAFRTAALKSINLTERDFRFEPEVTIKLASKHFRFYEVGISYYGRSYEEGKKIRCTDGFKALWAIFKHGISEL